MRWSGGKGRGRQREAGRERERDGRERERKRNRDRESKREGGGRESERGISATSFLQMADPPALRRCCVGFGISCLAKSILW